VCCNLYTAMIGISTAVLNPKVTEYQHTRGDALMRSQASLYRTVGEFFENNSDVRAYMSTAESPAPKIITARFEVR